MEAALATRVPPELVDMLRQRRVIPFLGAGFSASMGLPAWDTLLEQIASEVQGSVPYEKVKQCCQGDFLQIAEYYFLKSDKNIGPLRHHLSNLLKPSIEPVMSTAHVELINLNAQQIFTTNYDELIEKSFRQLGQPYSVVALPKDIAVADRLKAQIVKFHGDLRYDTTLVLTESSYYKRLDFESPMDLKFRSELLGRSVLFIGYSFRDVNIRIIWFKLMEMMKDVPQGDRPSSFVVRFEKNEVLEELYRAVGIETIYLDPDGTAKDQAQRAKLLGQFMLDLSLAVSDEAKMPGTGQQMFLSAGLVQAIADLVAKRKTRTFVSSRLRDPVQTLISNAACRIVPKSIFPLVDKLFADTLRDPRIRVPELANLARSIIAQGFSSSAAAQVIVTGLFSGSSRDASLKLPAEMWPTVWDLVPPTELEAYTKKLTQELAHHNEYGPDADLAYVAFVVKRLKNVLAQIEPGSPAVPAAEQALGNAAKTYSAVDEIDVSKNGPPNVDALLAQILEATSEPGSFGFDDDIEIRP